MKKQLLSLGLLALMIGVTVQVNAQSYVDKKTTDENGKISLVTFKNSSGINSSSINSVFQEILKLSSSDELKLAKSELDFSGKFIDEKYQQYFKGIPVHGGVYNVHYKGDKVSSINGEIFQDFNAVATPSISASQAFNNAVAKIGATKYMWEDAAYTSNNEYKKPTGELVFLPVYQGNGKHSLMLTYRFDIYAAEPISRSNVYVDAFTGRVIAIDPIMKHAEKVRSNTPQIGAVHGRVTEIIFPTLVTGTADTRYSGTKSIETTLSGTNYILHDTTRGTGVRTYNLKKSSTISSGVDFTDSDNNWTAAEYNNANFDNAALDAHWGVEKTYDYFKTTFNRNSYNGTGGLLKSHVHYGSGYDNAGWTGSEMIYGDGATYFTPLTAFDVTAHELGHGVCSTTANLAYQRESGALNEGFSDIWGVAAEYLYAPTKQNWLLGEEIVKVSPNYLRSISNPKTSMNPQPDTYHGTYWYPATVEEGCITPSSWTNDNCGVHTNSGVLNHWFYILSMGKVGTNDLGHSYSVTGITIEKAQKIAYRLETVYLTANSNYMNARNNGIQAAVDLYGADSPEAIATQDAFYAVGLGPKYLSVPDVIAPTAPTTLAASNITGSQAKLTWNPSTDENGIDKYLVFRDGVQIGTTAANVTTYTATGLARATSYNFYVKAQDPYNNISEESNTVNITTLDVPTYCTATSSNTNDERIKRVQFNTIDNESTGTTGYEDFTYLSTDVVKGNTYPIIITPQWTGAVYSEGYSVFVDFNNDGDFADTGENVFSKPASNTTPITGNIVIANETYTGPVRMRVMMKYNGVPTSCESYTYGQVEDYTLNIQNLTAGVNDSSNVKTVIYPNPVKDYIAVQSKETGEYTFKVFNISGQMVLQGSTNSKKINAEKLIPGNYIIELLDKAGNKLTHKFIKK